MGIGHLFRSTALSKDAPWRFGEPLPTRCTSLHLEGLRPSDVNPVTKWTHPAGVHSQEVPKESDSHRQKGDGGGGWGRAGRGRDSFSGNMRKFRGQTVGGGGVMPRVSLMPSNRVRLNRVKTVHIISFLRPFFFFFLIETAKQKQKITHTHTHTKPKKQGWIGSTGFFYTQQF